MLKRKAYATAKPVPKMATCNRKKKKTIAKKTTNQWPKKNYVTAKPTPKKIICITAKLVPKMTTCNSKKRAIDGSICISKTYAKDDNMCNRKQCM